MIGIYRITNLITGESYIGQSSNIHRRWINHKSRYKNLKSTEYGSRLYNDMRIYGIDNFEFAVIEECAKDELLDKEKFWVAQLDSYDNGYNNTAGGNSGWANKLPKNLLLKIIGELRNTSAGNLQIAQKYGVSENTVSGINTGHYWHQDDIDYPIRRHIPRESFCPICGNKMSNGAELCIHCNIERNLRKVKNRPEKDELARLIASNGFEGTGRIYGVNGNAVKKWCKSYGMSTYINDYRRWKKKERGKRRVYPVNQIDIDTMDIVATYPSISEAERKTGVFHIVDVINGKRKQAGGYYWKKVQDSIN